MLKYINISTLVSGFLSILFIPSLQASSGLGEETTITDLYNLPVKVVLTDKGSELLNQKIESYIFGLEHGAKYRKRERVLDIYTISHEFFERASTPGTFSPEFEQNGIFVSGECNWVPILHNESPFVCQNREKTRKGLDEFIGCLTYIKGGCTPSLGTKLVFPKIKLSPNLVGIEYTIDAEGKKFVLRSEGLYESQA